MGNETSNKPNWFTELEIYGGRAEEGQSKRENFFTTSFAWVLSKYPGVKKEVLETLFHRPDIDFLNAELRVQKSLMDGIPDIFVSVKSGKAFDGAIECKVDAGHDKIEKLKKYWKINDEEECHGVAYIYRQATKPPWEPEAKPETATGKDILPMRWNDILSILKKQLATAEESILLRDFVEYMEYLNMADNPLNLEDTVHVAAVNQFQKVAASLVKSVAEALCQKFKMVEDGQDNSDVKTPPFRGCRFKHAASGGRFGFYLVFIVEPQATLQAVVYLSKPDADGQAGELFKICKENHGWKGLGWGGEWPGIGLKIDIDRQSNNGRKVLFTSEYEGQVKALTDWATKQFEKIPELITPA